MSDEKYNKFFENVLPTSIIISNLKLALTESLSQKIMIILKEKNVKLTKDNQDDIERTTLEIVSQIQPSFFNIPLGWRPESEDEVKKKLDTFDQRTISKIVDEILSKLKSGQNSLSEYF